MKTKIENRKSKTGEEGPASLRSAGRVPPSRRISKERIANFELWFSNWVVQRD
jgi:hypothetical protein